MKKLIDSVKDSFIPSVTKTIDNAADNVRDTVAKAITFGDGNLITKNGDVYKNSDSSKGFAFEHTQEATFNANAALQGKPYEAIRIPPGGIDKINEEYGLNLTYDRLGEPDLIIINTNTGEIIKTIQTKVGDEKYILDSVKNPKYEHTTDEFVVNSDHAALANQYENVSTNIEVDGVTSMPMSEDMCITIAEHPELSANIAEQFANGSEILSGAAMGVAIGGALTSVQSSIKILAKVYKGEDVNKEVLANSIKEVFEAIKHSAFRGALVKVLQIIIDSEKENSSNLPVILVSVGIDTYPIILKYLQDEITLDEMIQGCGTIALSRGIIITLSMTYPPIGIGLIGYSILNTLWKEFELSQLLSEYIPKNAYFDKAKIHYGNIVITTNNAIVLSKKKTKEIVESAEEELTNTLNKTKENTELTIRNIKNLKNKFGVNLNI